MGPFAGVRVLGFSDPAHIVQELGCSHTSTNHAHSTAHTPIHPFTHPIALSHTHSSAAGAGGLSRRVSQAAADGSDGGVGTSGGGGEGGGEGEAAGGSGVLPLGRLAVDDQPQRDEFNDLQFWRPSIEVSACGGASY